MFLNISWEEAASKSQMHFLSTLGPDGASNNGNATNIASTESNVEDLDSLNSLSGSACYQTKFNIWPTLTIFDRPTLTIFDVPPKSYQII